MRESRRALPNLLPPPLSVLYASFFLDFIDSIQPSTRPFFSSPSTPNWSPAGSRQLAALRRARPAARFGQFAAESGEHSRFNYTDNEVCSDQMPKGWKSIRGAIGLMGARTTCRGHYRAYPSPRHRRPRRHRPRAAPPSTPLVSLRASDRLVSLALFYPLSLPRACIFSYLFIFVSMLRFAFFAVCLLRINWDSLDSINLGNCLS